MAKNIIQRDQTFSTIYNLARDLLGDHRPQWTDNEITVACDFVMEETKFMPRYGLTSEDIINELYACRQRARDAVIEAEYVYGID